MLMKWRWGTPSFFNLHKSPSAEDKFTEREGTFQALSKVFYQEMKRKGRAELPWLQGLGSACATRSQSRSGMGQDLGFDGNSTRSYSRLRSVTGHLKCSQPTKSLRSGKNGLMEDRDMTTGKCRNHLTARELEALYRRLPL